MESKTTVQLEQQAAVSHFPYLTFAPAITPESLLAVENQRSAHLNSQLASSRQEQEGSHTFIIPPTVPRIPSACPSRASSPALSRRGYGDTTSASKRNRRRKTAPVSKRAMNAFLIYRRSFPTRYPHIDQLERHQGPKSAIIGAMWRAEPLEVKEHFFSLQEAAAEAFRVSSGQIPSQRLAYDSVKAQMRREKVREKRAEAREEKLEPRSELIVNLWKKNVEAEELISIVREYDAHKGADQLHLFVDPTSVPHDSLSAIPPWVGRAHSPLLRAGSPTTRSGCLSSPSTAPSSVLDTPPFPARLVPQPPCLLNPDLLEGMDDSMTESLSSLLSCIPPEPLCDMQADMYASVAQSLPLNMPYQSPFDVIAQAHEQERQLRQHSTFDQNGSEFGFAGEATLTSVSLGGEENLKALQFYDNAIGGLGDLMSDFDPDFRSFENFNFSSPFNMDL